MNLSADQLAAINGHVRREGRDAVISYHEAHLAGARARYSDLPSVTVTKEKLRAYHAAALAHVMSLPLPVAKRRGGGA
jgi:hypothetical protein